VFFVRLKGGREKNVVDLTSGSLWENVTFTTVGTSRLVQAPRFVILSRKIFEDMLNEAKEMALQVILEYLVKFVEGRRQHSPVYFSWRRLEAVWISKVFTFKNGLTIQETSSPTISDISRRSSGPNIEGCKGILDQWEVKNIQKHLILKVVHRHWNSLSTRIPIAWTTRLRKGKGYNMLRYLVVIHYGSGRRTRSQYLYS